MKKITQLLALIIFLLVATVMHATAQSVTLVWDQNIEPEVVGYQIYYRTENPTFPFNGTDLKEGPSPIIVEGSSNTSLTLDLPEDGSLYYFAATAITDVGEESNFSNIIASEWIPTLIAPMNNAVIGDTYATFVWEQPPSDYNVSYNLIYGTNPQLNTNLVAVTVSNDFWTGLKLEIAGPLAFLLLLLLILNRFGRAKRVWHLARIGVYIGVFVLQASCGGGGGGDGSDPEVAIGPLPSGTAASEPPVPQSTNVVENIYDTKYQVTDLLPGNKYYWKVVAVDNWGNRYESLTHTFTTLGN